MDQQNISIDIKVVEERYQEICAQGLQLDMTRGKPSPEQLDLSVDMLNNVPSGDFNSPGGVDCRNYGGVEGLPEMRALMAEFLEVKPDEVIIGGNASLSLMHDTVVNAMLHGVPGSTEAWGKSGIVKFICPAPGYDRHFNICQHLGIEMIPVDMLPDGPDMDRVEELVQADASIKGIWIVPKYSNPTGAICSDQVVDRLAQMETAAKDFRVMWDNAYTVHHLVESPPKLKNILEACKDAGNADRVFIFGSTSKISFAGAGISVMGASLANIDWMLSHRKMQTIGPDKINQLRHLRFFKDMNGIEAHMKKHTDILKPKFEAVLEILENELGGTGLANWSKPEGGYFISLNVPDNCAKRTVELAGQAGVKLTPAGATYPYRKDPRNRNIRIAPSLPSLEAIKKATEVLAICVRLAAGGK